MILKSVFLFLFCALPAVAERQTISVLETSTSGRLVRISLGRNAGLRYNEPVLFSAETRKLAAGRVIRVDDTSSIVAVLESYDSGTRLGVGDFELLYGEPFDEAANLPDYVADREEEKDNPGNERFFEPDGREVDQPDLDDEDYTPEVTLRPKFPEPRTYSTHNITVGASLFRNRALATASTADSFDGKSFSTYNGYTLRYAYTFRSHYWLRQRTATLLSVELAAGMYNFSHTFPNAKTGQIRVTPLSFSLRYLIELNKVFRIYPYIGYQNNLVSATNITGDYIRPLRGGRLFGGGGGQLVMSNTIDTRLEGGTDGVTLGIVVKF